MSESRHSRGDAANVRADGTPAHGHVDEFVNVPTDEEFVGELGEVETWPYALTAEEIAESYDQRKQRRERRKQLERYRAWAILLGGLLVVALTFSPLPGIYAAAALLATFLAAYLLRRAGR